jgi:hypothetical protein
MVSNSVPPYTPVQRRATLSATPVPSYETTEQLPAIRSATVPYDEAPRSSTAEPTPYPEAGPSSRATSLRPPLKQGRTRSASPQAQHGLYEQTELPYHLPPSKTTYNPYELPPPNNSYNDQLLPEKLVQFQKSWRKENNYTGKLYDILADKTSHEALEYMIDKLTLAQRALGPQFKGEVPLHTTIVRACRGHLELEPAMFNTKPTCEALFSDPCSALQVYQDRQGHQYIQDTMDSYYTDWKYTNIRPLRGRGLRGRTNKPGILKICSNIVHWNSIKCKRVTRSVWASELYRMLIRTNKLSIHVEAHVDRLAQPQN